MGIYCDGHGVRLSGSTVDAIQDLSNVISAVRMSLAEKHSGEFADRVIGLCGQLAYATTDNDEERHEEMLQEIADTLNAYE